MLNVRLIVLIGVILAAAASRVIPHPPNFTPIAAMALFGGAQFTDRRLAFLVPLSAMFASDLIIGLHRLLPVIYACFALIVILGLWVRSRKSVLRIAGATLAGSVLFFVITNFAVWAAGSLYPKTLDGLVTAYVAAIPFFRNTVLGDAVYVVALFGGFALIESIVAALRDDSTPAARRQIA